MTIRLALLESSPFWGLVRDTFSDAATVPAALALALEGHFRTLPDLAPFDCFEFFHIAEETETRLTIVGMAHILPSSLLPIDASFQVVSAGIRYRLSLGSDDASWSGITEKKRWEAVYLYATEGYDPKWRWNRPLDGVLPP